MSPTRERTVAIERRLTQQDFDRFADLSGDDNPIHVDAGFAANSGFGRTVAHGALLVAILHGLVERLLPGWRTSSQQVMFPAPTYADRAVLFRAEVVALEDRVAKVRMEVTDQADQVVTCTVDAVFEDRSR
jgi:acyl dehydratase